MIFMPAPIINMDINLLILILQLFARYVLVTPPLPIEIFCCFGLIFWKTKTFSLKRIRSFKVFIYFFFHLIFPLHFLKDFFILINIQSKCNNSKTKYKSILCKLINKVFFLRKTTRYWYSMIDYSLKIDETIVFYHWKWLKS